MDPPTPLTTPLPSSPPRDLPSTLQAGFDPQASPIDIKGKGKAPLDNDEDEDTTGDTSEITVLSAGSFSGLGKAANVAAELERDVKGKGKAKAKDEVEGEEILLRSQFGPDGKGVAFSENEDLAAELEAFIDKLQNEFATVSDEIMGKIDSITARLEGLEKGLQEALEATKEVEKKKDPVKKEEEEGKAEGDEK